jgi:hypothetical protein
LSCGTVVVAGFVLSCGTLVVHEVNKRLPVTITSAEIMSFFIGVVERPRVAAPRKNCKPLDLRAPRRGFALAEAKLSSQRSPSIGLEIVAVLAFNAFRRNSLSQVAALTILLRCCPAGQRCPVRLHPAGRSW